MATCTIVLTTATPNAGDIIARSSDAASFVIYAPNGPHQTKRIVQQLESLIQSVLSLEG